MISPHQSTDTAPISNTPCTSPRGTARGFYQCGVCKKEYGRADHLIRHVRSHTADKPFSCEICGKGFGRIDLLRRHAQGHTSAHSHNRPNLLPRIRGRVSQACKSCAASKLKCDDEKPCRRCSRRNQTCQWSQGDDLNDSAHEQEIWPTDQSEEGQNGASVSSLQYESLNQEMEGLNAIQLMEYDQLNVYGGMNFELGLTDEDLEFLDSLDRMGPPQRPRVIEEQPAQRGIPTGSEFPSHVETNPLHNSPLSHWTPRAEDNAYMDQHYLSVPKHLDTPESIDVSRPRIFAEPLSKESRDAAFALVVKMCQQKALNRIMQCFPSAELLDSLIQVFFTQQRSNIDIFIHESTMQLNQESPEMILTLAAAGAVRSDVEAIQRLGYAMMEVARLQVNGKYEDNNILTRDLKQQQEYALILQIGLWSGDKRRVEIAESFAQPVVTMLRRASRFKYEAYSTIIPTVTDDDATLERKWREWVEHESFKRLAHHMFIHDAQASILRSINPLMSHMELDLPIPFSRKLWDAKTAAQWRSVYLQEVQKTISPMPSLATTLQNISCLSRFPRHGDFPLAALASVHGISTMIANCNQTRHGPSGQWSAMVMNLWQQELLQVLEQFEIVAVEPLQRLVPAIRLIYQTVSLSLYLPLGILETFSGKDGEKRSSDIYKSFIQPISAANMRQASWHAGQVLRIARSIPPGSLTDFCATCLYFSALALWSLSTIFSSNGLASGVGNDNDETVFLLDGESDSAALRRFTLSGLGAPALSSPNRHVPLNDRAAVMRFFQQLLGLKYRGGASDQQTRALNNAFSVLGNTNSTTIGGQRKRKNPEI
ncbi:C6 and C2H2 transcription factor [Penicillium concentricum]|uniref:C6 and C2H2 transcription factor n=1 Tax=Penicillium concentricum TaxID=293559 RepID=A0A9W9S4U0_9EURO|nr:C6 and C2H2 transcription factor [Penicillium concentricum]KAJ5372052.1 C6 and C2H2 transcription factor [Penicillium concentricum]